jgi:type III secretory pathway lipoprotein EscJ
LYTNLSEKEANAMFAILIAKGLNSTKAPGQKIHGMLMSSLGSLLRP